MSVRPGATLLRHTSHAGDRYLATGSPSHWKSYPQNPVDGSPTLAALDRGVGSGTCDVYPNG